MPTLFEQLQSDLKTAVLQHEDVRKDTIRLLIAACKKISADTGSSLDDDEVLNILLREKKTRQESIEQYTLGGREDLARKEAAEIEIIQTYLPVQLDESAITAEVEKVLAETGATTIKDMGKVMGLLGSHLKGKADMSLVSRKVKEALSP
ncbi:MAG TPA: GatB/YqeY domain-containing protein [bacterium]|nr:GatB/YqeY domain-containing protein [bacterium]